MMNNNKLSREYLDSLSSADLISLADEYGLDVPDDLNRQLIIGDLLEFEQELEDSAKTVESINISSDEFGIPNELPESYNETKINIILRNPVTVFVWWDLSDSLCEKITNLKGSIHLNVCFFKGDENIELDEKPIDSFDVFCRIEDRKQYVIIPATAEKVRVDLVLESNKNGFELLSSSEYIVVPKGQDALMNYCPGKEIEFSKIMSLSGIQELLRRHYNENRQSFN